jgi:electron transfer flavoprotein-quinone oxidoreductase
VRPESIAGAHWFCYNLFERGLIKNLPSRDFNVKLCIASSPEGAVMKQYKFDVIIIGAGPAGVTAAGVLAGTGISVALLEAGVYAGAENWSGCVYFAESLAEMDCFGPQAVESAPFERRVHRRGTLLHNGLDVVGLELASPETFKHSYTVLRPVYDLYFANLASSKGAVYLAGTTVTSLNRKDGRVIGVDTNRGPLYADLTFLAEGDASHLVRSERLERVREPHYLQGLKAVLSLRSEEIEQRFGLKPGEAAAYELLIRNALIAGRTAKLNVGGFLYTNRDSLSLGYVVPLDNVRDNYHGNHDSLFEWMRGLPYIKELTKGASLSSYGTKIIRSGGWRERPMLVEDGLAVGGASVGLGVDIPFPNFTGPASATGLYFARAAQAILLHGRAPDARNLAREYLAPLLKSTYGQNAEYLSQWPSYFGKSKVLFARTIDMVCGTAHFLSKGSFIETGRFLRSHILSLHGLRESITDTMRAIGTIRLWKPIMKSVIHPVTIGHWILNLLRKTPARDRRLSIILFISGRNIDAVTLPWPMGSLIIRLSPALRRALEQVYANDGKPTQKKFANAIRLILRGMRLTDLVILPVFGVALFFIALGTAIRDAFRFYILKTPVERLLAEPVMAYYESQKIARDLDAVRPSTSLEEKLATNTYRIGTTSHIRTLWPESIVAHPDMAQAGLWWVCPARVYVYDTPIFGRGRVAVNFENCIKCESCWRAEPSRVIWGRHTGHKLIFRPETGTIDRLLDSVQTIPAPDNSAVKLPEAFVVDLCCLSDDIVSACRTALNASAAFLNSIANLPASTDAGRRDWPLALGRRFLEKLAQLETSLANDGRHGLGRLVQSAREEITLRLSEGRLFHVLYSTRRVEQQLKTWHHDYGEAESATPPESEAVTSSKHAYEEVSGAFPDRVVKQWEDQPLPEDWAMKLRHFIGEHQDTSLKTLRVLSSVSPALGLIGAHYLSALKVMTKSDISRDSGVCAIDGSHLDIRESGDSTMFKGKLKLVPCAASKSLLILANGKGYIVPLSTPGITISPTPAIGFRAAGLSDISLSCTIKKQAVTIPMREVVPDSSSYLTIALGAAEYLCWRVKEHAASRIQFPGQMLDTEGRDGVAKLGAVKAMIARTDAWRILLKTLFEILPATSPAGRDSRREAATRSWDGKAFHNDDRAPDFDLLCSVLSAIAFGPERGTMGYDAGQVFGGFAYSEDDLLSRFYRDSSLFRFLPPGYGASQKLHATLGSRELDLVIPALGSLDTVRGEPLGHLASKLKAISRQCMALSPHADDALSGEAKAMALGIRGLLVAIEEGLNKGRSMEAEAAAAEVLIGLTEDAVEIAEMSAGRGTVPPSAVFPIEPMGNQVVPDIDYETFCAAPGPPHRSGSFLTTVFDRSPRFVPEMQLHDSKLVARWTELSAWFRKNCRDKKFDGLDIEHYVDKVHRLPDEIIAAIKQNSWLATYIPKSVDGLGWRKAEYYILNSAAGSFGDASIDLLIMASTSIGTTPILLGLEDELPRVREELAPLVQHEQKLGEIGTRLAKIIQTLANPDPAWIKKEYETVMNLVDERIRHTRVVKYLAANFLRAFYGAGISGRGGNFGGFIADLKLAGELFSQLMPEVRAALDELPRRERCHRLFLRFLGHGAVSAFALTEPTAGSDSGGVRTTAKLMSARLTPLNDGRYSFHLAEDGETSVRYLIDADKITFTDLGIAYQTADGQSAAIRYDKYDYATDQGTRYYIYQGKECLFHDIGQVRQSGTGLIYEYYSLTGAKMWITNGSIATQFCLYAQTHEGVTGFMVDRYAEGLKVGADEKKTGQRGSPTNEISIDSVRVPREAVVGYEGHGQVNALETLNVGRCGLAVVSGALMRKLMHEASASIPPSPERDILLGEGAAILFGSESLAYYLIGLFDRRHESVRMESAIAKYLCSEDIHELISLIERAFGPTSQTEKFLVEKARRDSRILTIYEGTNEVQRFLILKDMLVQAADWSELPESQGDDAARTLAAWKNKLGRHVKNAAVMLGDTSWSDAMLQPAMFPLAEMAGEILRLECVFYRLEWMNTRISLLAQSSAAYVPAMIAAAKRAADRAISRLGQLDRKYTSSWELVRSNRYMPEVRAADAALDRMSDTHAPPQDAMGILRAPFHILSIIRPIAVLSPHPRLADGKPRELVWCIDPTDLSALSQILELKTESHATMTVDVLMPGGPEHELLLTTAAGIRADNLYRLDIDPAAGADACAKSVWDLDALQQYDLIVTGADCLNGDRSLGAYLAGSLRRLHYRKERIEVKPDGSGLNQVALPAVISITSVTAEPVMNMSDAISSAFSRIQAIRTEGVPNASSSRFELPTGTETVTRTITNSDQAADYLKAYAASASTAAVQEYKGELMSGTPAHGDSVWFVLDPNGHKSNLTGLRASKLAADLTRRKARAVIPAPREMWPQLLGLAQANGCEQAFCFDTQKGMLSNDGKRELIRNLLKTSRTAIIFASTEWADPLAYVAGDSETQAVRTLLCSGVTDIKKHSAGLLTFSLPAYEGKLVRHHVLKGGSAFITVASGADFPAPGRSSDFTAQILDFSVSSDWIIPLPPVTALTLSQADVIIDLGYGIKDRSGLKLAQELKNKLEALGLAPMFGATRKVTQDLKLLPLETQIGQTGVRVNAKLIIALGISGAPQHIDYIGTRAEIICFNKDTEAPLMKLIQNRAAPRVHPIVGDLFVTVRGLIGKLSQ